MCLYAYKYTVPFVIIRLDFKTPWTQYNITVSTALLENVYHNNMIKDTINH